MRYCCCWCSVVVGEVVLSLVDVVSMLVIYRDVVDGGVVLLVGVWSSVDGDDGDDGVVLWQGAVALLVVGCCCW